MGPRRPWYGKLGESGVSKHSGRAQGKGDPSSVSQFSTKSNQRTVYEVKKYPFKESTYLYYPKHYYYNIIITINIIITRLIYNDSTAK